MSFKLDSVFGANRFGLAIPAANEAPPGAEEETVLEPTDFSELTPGGEGERDAVSIKVKKSSAQTAILIAAGAATLGSMFLGGGGPENLTQAATDSVIDESRDDTAWNETQALLDIHTHGVETRPQLNIIREVAEQAGDHDWAGANQVVLATLQNPDVSDTHYEISDELLGYLGGGDQFDATAATLAVIRAEGLNGHHHELARALAKHAYRNPEFTAGNALLEVGLANPQLGDSQLKTMDRLLKAEAPKEALASVLRAPELGDDAQELVKTLLAQDAPNWDLVEVITRTPVDESRREIVEGFLAARSSEGLEQSVLEILSAPDLTDQQQELLESVANSLKDEQWRPQKLISYVMGRADLNEHQVELAQLMLDRLDTEDGFQTVPGVVTVLETPNLEAGARKDMMEAVIRASAGNERSDGNRLLKLVSAASEFSAEQGENLERILNNQGGVDASQVFEALLNSDASVLARIERAEARVTSSAVSQEQLALANVVERFGAELAEKEGAGHPMLEAAFSNPNFGPLHQDLMVEFLQNEQPWAAQTIASASRFSDTQGEVVKVVAQAARADSNWGDAQALFGHVLEQSDISASHLEVVREMLLESDKRVPLETMMTVLSHQEPASSLGNYQRAAEVLPSKADVLHGQLDALPAGLAERHLTLASLYPEQLDAVWEASQAFTEPAGQNEAEVLRTLSSMPDQSPTVLLRRALNYHDTGLSVDYLTELIESYEPLSWQAEGTWTEVEAGVWSEAVGNYPDDAAMSLSRTIDLRHHRQAKLSFELKTDIEKKYDKLLVQVRGDGENWRTLAAFEGRVNDDYEFSLAQYDGSKVEVRFRLESDGSRNGDASRLSDLRVEGVPLYGGAPESVLAEGSAPPLGGLLDQSNLTAEDLAQFVATKGQGSSFLARMATRGAEELEAATRLEAQVGPKVAERLHERPGSPEDKASRFRAAAELARVTGEPGLEQAMALYGQYEEVPGQSLATLVKLVTPPITTQGAWGPAEAEGRWSADTTGSYQNDRNDSLMVDVDLTQVVSPTLSFRYQHDLEKQYDNVHLEVLSGGEWQRLTSFNGRERWSEAEYDLSPFQGQDVSLRFHFQSDGSRSGEGFEFEDLRVTARPITQGEVSEVVLVDTSADSQRQRLERLKDFLAKTPEDVGRLSAFAEVVGDLTQALDAWPHLAGVKQDQLVAIAPLVKGMGSEAYGLLPLLVEHPAGLDQAAQQAQEGWDFALKLMTGFGQKPEPEILLAMTRNLVARDLSASDPIFEELLANTVSMEADGTWVRTEEYWSDSPTDRDYANGLNDSLTSRAFPLGDHAPVVQFDARHGLEAKYDHVHLEVSVDGGEWRKVHSFNGSSRWDEQSVSLAGFHGQEARIRFRLETDSSRTDDGFDLKNLRVRDGSGAVLLSDVPSERVEAFEVLKSLLTDPSADIEGSLRETLAMTEQLGSVEAAVDLQAMLAPHRDAQDFEQVARLALTAAQEFGVPFASQVASQLSPGNSFLEQYGNSLVAKAAESVIGESVGSVELTPARVLEILPQLREAPTAGWTVDGWYRTEDSWAHSPFGDYGPDQRASLTTPTFRVEDGAKVRLEAGYDLEKNYDAVELEFSADGEEWQSLAHYTGGSRQKTREYDLPEGVSQGQLRLRFSSDGSRQEEGFELHSISVESQGRTLFSDDGGVTTVRNLLGL